MSVAELAKKFSADPSADQGRRLRLLRDRRAAPTPACVGDRDDRAQHVPDDARGDHLQQRRSGAVRRADEAHADALRPGRGVGLSDLENANATAANSEKEIIL
jgi:hypothetical protein